MSDSPEPDMAIGAGTKDVEERHPDRTDEWYTGYYCGYEEGYRAALDAMQETRT